MKVIILALLGCLVMILLSADISEMRIVGKSEKTTDIVSAKYQTVNRERAACIIFVTDLEVELDFRPNGQLVAVVQEAPGQWNVYVAPFERRIDVYAYGYKPLIVVLREFGVQNLQGSDVYRLQLTGDKPDVRSIENINIAVQATPRNAVIYLNNEKVEDSRQVLAKVGKNSLKIELIGYKTIIEEIEVSEQRTFFEYQMVVAMDVPVKIDTEPPGVSVFLNDVNCGKTPLQFFYQEGKYKLRLVSDLSSPFEEELEVKAPQTTKSYKLEDIRGILTIKTNPNSKVFINNQEYPQGVSRLKLPPQLAQIKITTPKATDINRSILIKEKEQQEIELYADVDTGTIGVNVMPVNANVLLTGDGGERFTSQGGQTFKDVPAGKYQLEIKAEGHKTHKESFDLQKDDLVRKQVILEAGEDDAVRKETVPVAKIDVNVKMIFVEGGTFQMGSNAGRDNEKPVHQVTVSDFFIGKYEVTQKEYQAVMGNNPSYWKKDNLPVEQVNWYDAIEYCNKLSIKEGLTPVYSINGNHSSADWSSGTITANWSANGYRLPTEAEWEFASRGGNKSKGYTYSGGNNVGDVAWHDGNSSRKTNPIGWKGANELGIYDMSGNVWEWCWDWYGNYTGGSKTNPKGASIGSTRVGRGGSWGYNATYCAVSNRSYISATYRNYNFGFRLSRSIP